MKRYKITTVPSWQKPKTKLGQVQIESRLIQDPSGQPPKTIMSIYRASNFIRREIRTQRSRMRKMRRSSSDIGQDVAIGVVDGWGVECGRRERERERERHQLER